MSKERACVDIEKTFPEDKIIVSRTDEKGRITYCNSIFIQISEYSEKELIDQPHSILRHPDMPRCVFKLLWDTIMNGKEIFAYVKNRCKNGEYYWVLAHVTPDIDDNGNIIGYYSNRRSPKKEIIQKVIPLYKALLDIENQAQNRAEGLQKSYDFFVSILQEKGVTYDQFIFSL